MSLRWTDVNDIAIELVEAYPDVDAVTIRFTDLHRWVMELPGFDDDPNHSGEKVLEAIQAAWIEELE
ncbi:MAG TPA: Fe-S cluster assembly protein IscX [Pseudomonadales bacterium]|nr:Fe-S cluster assembly protein IscX [Pseudomonadales bacterium]MDP6267393.1 Fe-S cluster assembly protein IscX [Arenicellales bacterium]MDP7313187.1 Fe-S cluster assembly protein IscX [Pseudomonadales bacterium]MDP7452237.1 Fe-S cluster assembly protein IscX [Arenicellales bacterium]HJL61241.1 Fe-S cluster assembly protein IscX [Pseudomonadales bacterium]